MNWLVCHAGAFDSAAVEVTYRQNGPSHVGFCGPTVFYGEPEIIFSAFLIFKQIFLRLYDIYVAFVGNYCGP